jgi:hypothetical protein
MVIEETFRYHQFYGSITLLIPMLAIALLRRFGFTFQQAPVFVFSTAAFIGLEFLLIAVWYEMNCGASELKWIQKVRKLPIGRTFPWLFLAPLLLYILLIIVFGYTGGFGLRLAVLVSVLVSAGMITASNAVAALRRYSERIESLHNQP